jgi:hypothetical protein
VAVARRCQFYFDVRVGVSGVVAVNGWAELDAIGARCWPILGAEPTRHGALHE